MTYSTKAPPKQRIPLERETQKAIVTLFKACGGIVYSTSQGYRKERGGTRCTPGIPDLWTFFPRLKRGLWWETKRPGGKPTAEQVAFGTYCIENGVGYGLGGVEDAKRWLSFEGLLTERV